MMSINKYFTLLFVFVFICPNILADEGMWLLNQMPPMVMQSMKDMGLRLDKHQLYDTQSGMSLKDAVVDFGGYCSGVVVSSSGLVMTNHHCGLSSIQSLSTLQNNYIINGFSAKSLSEELPVNNLHIRFLISTEEITAWMNHSIDSVYSVTGREVSDAETNRLADSICWSLEKNYAALHPGMECSIKKFFSGNAFYSSVYKVYRDIRLVMAFPEEIGRFGGDRDNWMWPRQTCDLSIFRIYAAPDGSPAEYSSSNVPLSTPCYASINTAGYDIGDFTMTIGYPGSSNRYLSSYGVSERMFCVNIPSITVRAIKHEIWKKWMTCDSLVSIQYKSKYNSSNNYSKKAIGMNESLQKLNVVDERRQRERSILQWCMKDSTLYQRFGHVLEDLEDAYKHRAFLMVARTYYQEVFYQSIELRNIANMLATLPFNANEELLCKRKQELNAALSKYNKDVDKELAAKLLECYRDRVSEEFLPDIYETIDKVFKGNCQAYVDSLYKTAICFSTEGLDEVMENPDLVDENLDMLYAQSIPSMYLRLGISLSDYNNRIERGERLLTQAILEMEQEQPHYSDANFTMRVSYGCVQPFLGIRVYTTSRTLLDKAKEADLIPEYSLSPKMTKIISKARRSKYANKKMGDLPLCFLTTNDITGGNSGSPIFNATGELIGLAFDGNWEAMSGSIKYEPELQRCIGVDIRYVLYLIEKWGKGERLLKEMAFTTRP